MQIMIKVRRQNKLQEGRFFNVFSAFSLQVPPVYTTMIE